MGNSIFDDLYISAKQAESIAKGELKPASVTRYEVADVKAIRAQLHITQKELANAMDVSVETVKKWEQGKRNPTGLANKVLALLSSDPSMFEKFALH